MGRDDTAKYIGDKASWESTQNMMRTIHNDLGVQFTEADGEAAFYGRSSLSRFATSTARGYAHHHPDRRPAC
jgi:threonyl-tRNA synthetase